MRRKTKVLIKKVLGCFILFCVLTVVFTGIMHNAETPWLFSFKLALAAACIVIAVAGAVVFAFWLIGSDM